MVRIILLILFYNSLIAQNCLYEGQKIATYNNMELWNYATSQFDQINKNNEINAAVIVDTDDKLITFNDLNYKQNYFIISCSVTDSAITYKCVDIKNKRKCDFKFSKDKSLTVTYFCEPVVYRVKQIKIIE